MPGESFWLEVIEELHPGILDEEEREKVSKYQKQRDKLAKKLRKKKSKTK